MGLYLSCHRMFSGIRKSRTYAGILQGSLQEGLPHALALLIPPDIATVLLIEHYHRKFLTSMREYSISHGIHRYDLSIAHAFLIKNPEAVSLLKSKEINCPCIYVRKADDKKRRNIRSQHIVP